MDKLVKESDPRITIRKRNKNHEEIESSRHQQQQQLFLSDELIEDILLRVPPKTLFRFKCVCRSWRTLISDRSFVTRLLQSSKPGPPLIVGFFNSMIFNDFGGRNKNDDSSLTTKAKFLSLNFLGCASVAVIASHKGLLLCVEKPKRGWSCYHRFHRFQYIVCNPLTKKWVSLPKPNRLHDIKNVLLVCYNNNDDQDQSIFQEFKVFSIGGWNSNTFKLETYSSESRRWDKYLIFERLYRFRPLHRNTLFDTSSYSWDPITRHLCVYDLEKHCARFIVTRILTDGVMGVSSGSLYYAESSDTCFSVWVFLDDDFKLWHRVEFGLFREEFSFPHTLESHGAMFHPLQFHPLDRHIVLVRLTLTGKLALYHIDRLSIEVIDTINADPFFQIIPYELPAWPPRLRNAW